MADLPTKKTLDDIERFGNDFTNGFSSIRNLLTQNLTMAKKYIVIDEVFDENGVRTSHEFHPNLAFYSEAEKTSMLMYYDFLKSTTIGIATIETLNGVNFYEVMNTRAKLDQLIALTMQTVLVG